jgi:hypothetical protein
MDVFTLGQHGTHGYILILSSHLRLITQVYFRRKCWGCTNSNFSCVTSCLSQSRSHAVPVTVTQCLPQSQSHAVTVTVTSRRVCQVTKSRSAYHSHVTQCLPQSQSHAVSITVTVMPCLSQSRHAVPVIVTSCRSYHSHEATPCLSQSRHAVPVTVTPCLSLTHKCLHALTSNVNTNSTILVLLLGI